MCPGTLGTALVYIALSMMSASLTNANLLLKNWMIQFPYCTCLRIHSNPHRCSHLQCGTSALNSRKLVSCSHLTLSPIHKSPPFLRMENKTHESIAGQWKEMCLCVYRSADVVNNDMINHVAWIVFGKLSGKSGHRSHVWWSSFNNPPKTFVLESHEPLPPPPSIFLKAVEFLLWVFASGWLAVESLARNIGYAWPCHSVNFSYSTQNVGAAKIEVGSTLSCRPHGRG